MQHNLKKLLSLLLMLSAVVGLLPGLTAAADADQIPYIEASYAEGTGVTYTSKTAEATALTSSSTSLNDGWYYVTGNVTVSSRISVSGTVNLILCDGATLTANAGINVASDQTLNIYAQEGGTGVLTSTGSGSDYQAGIGGGHCAAGGTVVIHGGTVNATGASVVYNGIGGGGAGIGGGGGSDSGAGIGGGGYGAGGTVTISGGTVTANGGNGAQGIGHGTNNSTNGTLTVGSGLAVYGDNSNSDPTTVITDYATTRYRYMKVMIPPVSYVEMSFDVNTLKLTSEEKTVKVYTVVSSEQQRGPTADGMSSTAT